MDLYNETEAAKLLGLSKMTMRVFRHGNKGPAYCRFGRRIMYRLEDLEAYVSSCRVDPKNQYDKANSLQT